ARAIVLAGLGAPLSLILATGVSPGLWVLGVVWALAAGMLCVLDAALAPGPKRDGVAVTAPTASPIGSGPIPVQVNIAFGGRGPRDAEYMLETNPLAIAPLTSRRVPCQQGGCMDEVLL